MSRKTLVIGASLNESRYSNIAIHKLKANNHFVEAVGLNKGIIADVIVITIRIMIITYVPAPCSLRWKGGRARRGRDDRRTDGRGGTAL